MQKAFNIIIKKGINPGDQAFAITRTSAIKIECPACHGACHQEVMIFNRLKDVQCPTCQGVGSCNGYEISNIHVYSIDIHEFGHVYYRDREYMSRSLKSDQMYKTYDEAAAMMHVLNAHKV